MMKQVLKYFAILAVFGTLMGAGCPRDKDNPTGLPEQIVFWGRSGTQNALYLTEPGSSTIYSKVIDVSTMVTNARLSPDKFRILWTENNQLKACKYDGTGLVTWPSSLTVLNAEWGEGSDTIIFETLTGREIRETTFGNSSINNLLYSGVSGLTGTPSGFNFTFFVISNATPHHAKSDGGGEFGWNSEPVGTDVVSPVLSFDNDEVAYQAFDGSKYILKTSNGSRIKTVSTTQDMDYHWPVQMLSDGRIIATHTETSGPGSYKYILSVFNTDGTTQLISEIANNTISKPDLNGSGDGVVYTRGNELFHYYLTNNATYQVGAGLDRAGYGDMR